jgi:hypothetical protein
MTMKHSFRQARLPSTQKIQVDEQQDVVLDRYHALRENVRHSDETRVAPVYVLVR